MKPFKLQVLPKTGIVTRLLKSPPKQHAFIEIENLLAAREVADISPEEIDIILKKYNCSEKDHGQAFVDLYGRAVEFLAQDRSLSDNERSDLTLLGNLLKLEETSTLEIRLAVVIPLFEAVVREVIQEGTLKDSNERLLTIADNLAIPEETCKEVVSRQASTIIGEFFQEAFSDNRVTPEEEERLQSLLMQFTFQGSADVLDESSKGQWAYYKNLWSVSRGEFVDQDVPVRLQKGERCAYYLIVEHCEIRTETRRVRYAGPTASIRVMKGVRFRFGDLAVNKVTRDVMKHLDSGTLYLTTKRLLFDGQNKSVSIPLGRVMNYRCFTDGILIEKDSGRDQVFKFAHQYDPHQIDAILEGLLS